MNKLKIGWKMYAMAEAMKNGNSAGLKTNRAVVNKVILDMRKISGKNFLAI
jgi:hypothetical protein